MIFFLNHFTLNSAIKIKYLDDASVAVSVNLKENLQTDVTQRPKPLNYHERTMQYLPQDKNMLQTYFSDAELFAVENNISDE